MRIDNDDRSTRGGVRDQPLNGVNLTAVIVKSEQDYPFSLYQLSCTFEVLQYHL